MTVAEKYIYQVYCEKSFSKAAKALFISQPSLSATVSNKESELGFKIFDRTTKPISLTAHGHIYIDMLEQIVESETNMHRRIQSLSDDKRDSLAIGGSFSTAYYLMPSVCGKFHRQHPNIKINLDIGNYGAESSLSERFTLNQKLDRAELDAVFAYEYDPNKYKAYKIFRERYLVAMPRPLLTPQLAPCAVTYEDLLHKNENKLPKVGEQNLFTSIPFLCFSRTSNITKYMEELLGSYTHSPYTVTNARHLLVHFNLMRSGVGALLTTDYIVTRAEADYKDTVFFLFDAERSTRDIYLITKKGVTTSSHLRDFIDTAQRVGEKETVPL